MGDGSESKVLMRWPDPLPHPGCLGKNELESALS